MPSLPMPSEKQRKDILIIRFYVLNRDKTFKFEIEREIVKTLVNTEYVQLFNKTKEENTVLFAL